MRKVLDSILYNVFFKDTKEETRYLVGLSGFGMEWGKWTVVLLSLAYISEGRFPAPLRGPAENGSQNSRHDLLRPPASQNSCRPVPD